MLILVCDRFFFFSKKILTYVFFVFFLFLFYSQAFCLQGTDATYLAKQHIALGAHPNYLQGADKTKANTTFGIRHYAGDVAYQILGFLDKNKDTQQDQLFEYMTLSKNFFVKDVTRFQDMLNQDRKIAGSKGAGGGEDNTRTSKVLF